MSCPTFPADVQNEREASTHRLLGVWSSLADRYTTPLGEDDIIDIRTGEIVINRGLLRKSRKVHFGAIAAPDAKKAIIYEGSDEDENDLDELDAFADATDKVDVTETGLRVKPVSPITALNLADAEDLRSFLEAERRRKNLCGSDVGDEEVEEEEEEEGEDEEEDEDEDEEEEDVVHIQESKVVEHEIVNLVSEDELDNWDVDESSVVVVKHHDSDVPSSTTNFRSPSIPQAEFKTLQKSPRKRKRVSSNFDDLPSQDQPPTVYKIPDNKVVKYKSPRRSSSRSQRPRPSPKLSVSGSESESYRYSSDSEQEYNHKPSRSHYDNFQFPYQYPYPSPHQSYLPSPRRNQLQQYQHQHHPPPEMFAPPIPDPRAQFIITQAMHQLSALASTPWIPPHDSSFIPQTPSRRHQYRRANSIFNTPNHPHPYPYLYDPNLSFASFPPESSPESISSPEKLSSSSHGQRKSFSARARSRSRGNQSFKIDRGNDRVEVHDRVDAYSSPSKGKGKASLRSSDRESSVEESPSNRGCERDDRKSHYLRGQTPGPEIGLAKGVKKLGQDSKRRLKGGLGFAA